MSANGMVRHGRTSLTWDEHKNEMWIEYPVFGQLERHPITYDGAREILDCLMVIFGRSELVHRYPEVR